MEERQRLLESEANTWEESKKMWRVTFPAMLSRVSSHGVFVVTQAFIGHISSTELAAYALLQILGILFVNGLLVNMGTSVDIGVIFWILCLVLGRKMAYVFTSNEAVVKEVSNLVVLLAFTILLNSVQPVQSGRQGMVAWVIIISYYVIGIPSGVLLAYVAHLDVTGIWTGMLIGSVTQTVWLGFMIWRTDWDEQVEKAAERLNRWFLRKQEDVLDRRAQEGLAPGRPPEIRNEYGPCSQCPSFDG